MIPNFKFHLNFMETMYRNGYSRITEIAADDFNIFYNLK